MSLLDTNDLDPRLTPELLLNLYGISKRTYISYSNEPLIYSKGYVGTKYVNNKYVRVLIEVWYSGSYYAGTLWRYNGYKLKRNMVYVQFLDPIDDSWSKRPEYAYDNLTLEEFDFMYKAIKNNDIDLLDNLYIHKPYTVFSENKYSENKYGI